MIGSRIGRGASHQPVSPHIIQPAACGFVCRGFFVQPVCVLVFMSLTRDGVLGVWEWITLVRVGSIYTIVEEDLDSLTKINHNWG